MSEKKLLALQRKLTTGSLRKSQLLEKHNEIADTLIELGRSSDAIFHLKEALELTERKIDRARIQRMIGEVYMDNGWMLEAEPFFREYVENATGNNAELQRAYLTLGRFLYIRGCDLKMMWKEGSRKMLDEAETLTLRSLKFKEGGTAMESRLYLNLALIVDELNRPRETVAHLQKSKEIAEENNHSEELFRCLSAICSILRRSNGADRAIHILSTTAHKCAKRAGKDIYVLWACDYSETQIYLDNLDGAKRTLESAAVYLKPSGVNEELKMKSRNLKRLLRHRDIIRGSSDEFHRSILKLSDIYLKLEMPDKARQVLEKMPPSALNNGTDESMIAQRFYVLSGHVCKAERKFANACEFYEKSIALKRSPRILLDLAVCKLNSNGGKRDIYALIEEAIKAIEQRNRIGYRSALEQFLYAKKSFDDDTSDVERTISESGDRLGDVEKLGSTDESTESSVDSSSAVSELLEERSTLQASITSAPNGQVNVTRNAKGETPLHLACIRGQLKNVKKLIEASRHPINVRDNNGWLPLHEAINHNHLEVARYLLEHGGAINDRGAAEGITPLHDACQNGLLAMIELLLDHGANPAIRSMEGKTPLDDLKLVSTNLCLLFRAQRESNPDIKSRPTEDELDKCFKLESRMLAHILSVFPDYKPSDVEIEADVGGKQSNGNSQCSAPLDDPMPIISQQTSATQIYRSAIEGVRRKILPWNDLQKSLLPSQRANKRGAFVSELAYNSPFVTDDNDCSQDSSPKSDRPLKRKSSDRVRCDPRPPFAKTKKQESDEQSTEKTSVFRSVNLKDVEANVSRPRDLRRLCIEAVSRGSKEVIEKIIVPFDASRTVAELGKEALRRLSYSGNLSITTARVVIRTKDDFGLCDQDILCDVIDHDNSFLVAEIYEV
ncbi:hypothetical protein ACOME3_006276 [Neoechinorhynchus agilis]